MTATKQIGIAIVEHDGRYLVGERGPDVPLAGFAEFPGGKFQDDESAFDCAVRECIEESGLTVAPSRLLQVREFEYPHGWVELHFVVCHPVRRADVRDLHNGFRWETVERLLQMKFPEANTDVIALLKDATHDETNSPESVPIDWPRGDSRIG